MKKYLVAFLFFLSFGFHSLKAQMTSPSVELGFYTEYFQIGYRAQQQFGFIFHYRLNDRFTLNWQAGIGPSTVGGFYVHAPVGAAVGGWIIQNSGLGSWWKGIGVLTMLIPEGVGMYVSEGKFPVHISVNPLGLDYWYRNNPYQELGKMSGSVMCRMVYRKKIKETNYYFAPQAGGSLLYNPENKIDRLGLKIGVTIGFSGDL
ncbi:MAG: hypothetical protein Fur0041_22880 [Bacteroidia bacterium]